MKKLLLPAFMLMLLISAAGCASAQSRPSDTPPPAAASQATASAYQQIKPEDVKKMMDDGETAVVVDVRTAGEYSGGHLKGAVNIPVSTIVDGKPAELPDLNAKIVVYCRTGVRSASAANELVKQGYTSVYDMGGIVSWPYDTVTGTDAPDTSAPTDASTQDGVLSAFKAEDIDGSPVDETIFNGKKLTMVNIWATFCSPCLQEMPDLGKLNASYADKGFQVVGIVIDAVGNNGEAIPDMVDTAKEIVGKTGAGYTHILPSADLAELLGQVTAVPTTIFVDGNGSQVGETVVGAHSSDEWTSMIDSLLKEVK